MTTILTAGLPAIGALIAAIAVALVWSRITPPMSWQRLLRYLAVPVAFFVVFFALGALAVALVSGDVLKTLVVDGSRGPVLWQMNSVVIFDDDGDTVERRRLDIFDIDTGRRVKRHDYVRWAVIPDDDVELLGEGRDFVWLYSARLGLHTRDAYDGHWLHGQRELVGDVPIGSSRALDYDAATRGLFVKTKQGKRFLDPSTLALGPRPRDESPNPFAAHVDSELTTPAGQRYAVQLGELRRVASGALIWERVGTGRFPDGHFVISAQLQQAYPDTLFIAHQGNLSRVEQDGSVRWTRASMLDSSRIDMDYAFVRNRRLCIVQDGRLACFSLDNGEAQWMIR